METSSLQGPPQDKTLSRLTFCQLLALFLSCATGGSNPHQPYQLTWQITNFETHEVLNETSHVAPLNTWFPDLYFNLDKIALTDKHHQGLPKPNRFTGPTGGLLGTYITDQTEKDWQQARRISVSRNGFYACPGFRTEPMKSTCGGIMSLYCASWSCVTTNDGAWKWKTQPWYISMSYVQPCTRTRYSATCNLIRVKFEEAAKTDPRWTTGLIWGLNLYQTPAYGLPIQIRLLVNPVSAPVPVGPNPVLTGRAPPQSGIRQEAPTAGAQSPPGVPNPVSFQSSNPPSQTGNPVLTGSAPSQSGDSVITGKAPPQSGSPSPPPSKSPLALAETTHMPPDPETSNRLLSLIRGAYLALNQTRPESTTSCWLCLASSPPYYEGIASISNFTNSTSHFGCAWEQHKKLTLAEVSGSGTCIGRVPPSHQHLCNRTLAVPRTSHYLIPSGPDWWACNAGLTPCVSTAVFNNNEDYCILVQVVPQVYYQTAESFESQFDQKYLTSLTRMRREPVSLTLAVMLGLGVAAGVGTGTAALVSGSYHLQQLRTAVDEDLRAIEHSITKLEESLTSLSEVVLQNRRGLDIIFLKEGGLCAALKEQCCFYADHSGVVKDSMAKLRKRLDDRQRERESQQSWFETWYSQSPWFSTLISTILGPLILLMLILTFGPCIFNRLLTLIKDKLNIVHAMVLTQRYQAVKTDEETQD
ncbi:chromobox protein homolog 5 isoform X1 [Pan paniscus]|uniref:chromobox protein homolog 5 isoform X1 n=1 Tax=Pan paniscus TaxID=9597 RepID=UPI0006C9631B